MSVHTVWPHLRPEQITGLKDQRKRLDSSSANVLTELAEDEDLHPEIQLELVDVDVSSVRFDLAQNRCLVEEAQQRIFDLKEPGLLETLASNPAAAPKIQMLLARLGEEEVSYQLAGNPSVTLEVQEILATAPGMENAQRALANNQATDSTILRVLWDKAAADDEILSELLKHPSLPRDLVATAVQGDAEERQMVALNPSLTADQQETLAGDESFLVRASLAQNERLELTVLLALAKDPNERLRGYVAFRPDLPEEVQAALSMDSDRIVHAMLRQNENITCTPRFGASYVKTHAPDFYMEYVEDIEAADALVEGWNGSLESLVEAINLTHR